MIICVSVQGDDTEKHLLWSDQLQTLDNLNLLIFIWQTMAACD